MKKIVLALVLGVVAAGLSAPADAEPRLDSVRVWNSLALTAVRATRATDADAARTYAMLNVAIYDAVNGLAHPARAHALVPGPGPRGADSQAAAVAAAHAVLVRLDPARAPGYDTQLQADLAGLRPGHQRDAGVRWGREVGERVVASRADDGSTPAQSQPAGAGPGVFRAEWSGVQYRDVRPFAITNPAAYVPGPPPALDGLDYAAAFAEVSLLGDAAIPAPDKLATFQFWSPEYPSGHSSYSGAAAAVLAGFFCTDNIRFTLTTDTAPGGQARTYPGFSAAAAEAGKSRVYGGQHFEFSNQAGLALGRGVATEVLATRLLKRNGPTHHGDCPL